MQVFYIMLSVQEKQKILQDINVKQGKSLLNLEKCNEFYNSLLRRKEEILEEVNFQCECIINVLNRILF